MSNIYADSHYAHERVGFDLRCESGREDVAEGGCYKCVHCHDEFEYDPGFPKACIERIALEVERLRGRP